jgi:peptidoglycan hydrolase-like protein with peptidoglycan-binding domain
MEELQTLLNHIGQQHNFSAGPPDGQAGRKTFDAISAFQRLAGLNVDGKPTTQVLAAARKIGTSGVGMAAGVSQETESQAAFKIERCMRDSELAQTGQLVPNLFDQTASQLPMNIKPYLAGFCMPENEDHLKSAFLYLVAQGALHAR